MHGPQRAMSNKNQTTEASEPDREQSLGQLESTLAELEALVERLESGDLPLEQALGEFERGMKLTRECQSVLKGAEQKVEILLSSDEDAEPVPFEPEEEDDED